MIAERCMSVNMFDTVWKLCMGMMGYLMGYPMGYHMGYPMVPVRFQLSRTERAGHRFWSQYIMALRFGLSLIFVQIEKIRQYIRQILASHTSDFG